MKIIIEQIAIEKETVNGLMVIVGIMDFKNPIVEETIHLTLKENEPLSLTDFITQEVVKYIKAKQGKTILESDVLLQK